MKNVAFIPVRGGSKSIPLKNIKEIAGKPLVYWTIRAAEECDEIDEVYVSTDSGIIKDTVGTFNLSKTVVIERGAETATDTASTESALLEFAEKYEFDNVVLIQATSPLLNAEDLRKGWKIFFEDGTDSVLSVVHQKRFNWNLNENGFAKPVNYDVYNRPRRQDFDGYYVENGAFYITSKNNLIKTGNRLSGNIRLCEMDEASYYEIDEPSDWIIIEKLLEMKNKRDHIDLSNIKMFLTDCDGCLTDGGMYYSENGDELKKFHTHDGMGFSILKDHGILTGIITGESRELNRRRAEKLKIDIYREGVKDKLTEIRELCKKYGLDLDNVLYIGDDVNDIEVIKNVGFGCTVKNGMDSLKKYAKYVTSKNGGEGAVREVVDLFGF